MHAHVSEAEFLQDISGVLGCFYLIAALMNLGAACYWWRSADERRSVLEHCRSAGSCRRCFGSAWPCSSACLVPLASSGDPAWMRWISFPPPFRGFLDRIMGPTLFMVGSTVVLGLLLRGPQIFHATGGRLGGAESGVVVHGYALTDPDFAAIVSKPDNVPIVGLIFLLGFFTWLSARKAVLNDRATLPRPRAAGRRKTTSRCWSGPIWSTSN